MIRVSRFLFFLYIFLFLFLSCEKGTRNVGLEDWLGEEDSPVSNGNYFYHDLLDLIVNEDGQNLEVSIRTNGKWEISADISWIKLSKSSGKGNAIISMQIQDNSTYENRKGKISIINLSRNQRFETSVEQIGRNRSLNGHEYVDLGMTDSDRNPIYWGTCNIGAASPKEIGDFFAWGETKGSSSGKTVYNWDNYKWNPVYDYNEQEYIVKDHLDPSDDAATANWGSKWRMPTYYELHMLTSMDKFEWISDYDESQQILLGVTIKSKSTHKSIYLPVAKKNEHLSGIVNNGYWARNGYWRGDVSCLTIGQHEPYETEYDAAYGLMIRPVYIP